VTGEHALDVYADLAVEVGDAKVSVRGYGDLVVVRAPTLAAARGLAGGGTQSVLERLCATEVTVDLRVGPDGRYRSVRRTTFAGPPRIRTAATLDRYGADGTEHMLIESRDGRRYVRQRITFGGTDLATDWSRRVLSRYLDANRSRVEALRQPDRTWYRIVVREPPPTLGHAARDYRATAVVAPDGLVTRVSVDYVHPGTGAAVAVRLRLDSPATPERPPWVESGPATAGRDRTA
jgi:hypothetical protein